MAVQPKNHSAGASINDPTRASKPAQETYKAPKLNKGGIVPPQKLDVNGKPLDLTGYGQNQATVPASVSVTQAGGDRGRGMSDLDIAPPGGDSVLALIASGGFGDRSEEGTPIADLERKVDTSQYPAAHGMRNRINEGKGVIPGTIGGSNGPLPKDPAA